MEFVADYLQELVAGFLVEQLGEIQEVAVRNVSGGIVVPGDAARKFGLGIDLLHPDVQRLAGVVPRVAVPAAVISGDFHQEVGRVVLAQDVGVNVGAVERAGDDVFFGQVGGFHRLSADVTRLVVRYVGLGNLKGVFRIGRAAGVVPGDDSGEREEEFLSALDVRNLFVAHPAVDSLLGGMIRQEVGEFLDTEFLFRVEEIGVEFAEEVPDVAGEDVQPGKGRGNLFLWDGLKGVEFFVQLLLEGFGRLGGLDGCLVEDAGGFTCFGHSFVFYAAALSESWRVWEQKSQRRFFRWQRWRGYYAVG